MSPAQLRERLSETFGWLTDRGAEEWTGDLTGWWRDPELLAELGPALADLFGGQRPTVVVGTESRGCLLGPLVAMSLGIGFVEVRKNHRPAMDSDEWVQATTPPDYRDRHLSLGFPRRLVAPDARVLMVDDWVDTGGQGLGVKALVAQTHANWIGVAAVVDGLRNHQTRRTLGVRAILNQRDLE